MKLLLLNIALIVSALAQSQNLVSIDFSNDSRLTINGYTNVIPFKLEVSGEYFKSASIIVSTKSNDKQLEISNSTIHLSLNEFKSNNKMALRDFKKLLGGSEHSKICVEVSSFAINKDNNGQAIGRVIIKGIAKEYRMPFTFKANQESFFAEAKIRINIKDFGLDPPIEMMGLIKVSEWIDISMKLKFVAKTLDINLAENISK